MPTSGYRSGRFGVRSSSPRGALAPAIGVLNTSTASRSGVSRARAVTASVSVSSAPSVSAGGAGARSDGTRTTRGEHGRAGGDVAERVDDPHAQRVALGLRREPDVERRERHLPLGRTQPGRLEVTQASQQRIHEEPALPPTRRTPERICASSAAWSAAFASVYSTAAPAGGLMRISSLAVVPERGDDVRERQPLDEQLVAGRDRDPGQQRREVDPHLDVLAHGLVRALLGHIGQRRRHRERRAPDPAGRGGCRRDARLVAGPPSVGHGRGQLVRDVALRVGGADAGPHARPRMGDVEHHVLGEHVAVRVRRRERDDGAALLPGAGPQLGAVEQRLEDERAGRRGDGRIDRRVRELDADRRAAAVGRRRGTGARRPGCSGRPSRRRATLRAMRRRHGPVRARRRRGPGQLAVDLVGRRRSPSTAGTPRCTGRGRAAPASSPTRSRPPSPPCRAACGRRPARAGSDACRTRCASRPAARACWPACPGGRRAAAAECASPGARPRSRPAPNGVRSRRRCGRGSGACCPAAGRRRCARAGPRPPSAARRAAVAAATRGTPTAGPGRGRGRAGRAGVPRDPMNAVSARDLVHGAVRVDAAPLDAEGEHVERRRRCEVRRPSGRAARRGRQPGDAEAERAGRRVARRRGATLGGTWRFSAPTSDGGSGSGVDSYTTPEISCAMVRTSSGSAAGSAPMRSP